MDLKSVFNSRCEKGTLERDKGRPKDYRSLKSSGRGDVVGSFYSFSMTQDFVVRN